MARRTLLKNRFPQIIATLDPKVDAAVKAGAELIAADAKTRVHVDSGDLKESIHTEPAEGESGHLVIAGDEDVFYGHFEEFGAAGRPPHPFLIPAAEANMDNVLTLVVAAVRQL